MVTPNPYYTSSEVNGTDVSEFYVKDAKSSVGDTRLPRSGRAWLFDGVDDYISVPHDPIFNITEQITMACWVKWISSGSGDYALLINKGRHETYDLFAGLNADFRPWVRIPSIGDLHRGEVSTLSSDTWYHIACSVDAIGGESKMYINAELVHTDSFSPNNIGTTSHNIYISDSGSVYPFHGNIKDPLIYNVALSASQINSIYSGIILDSPILFLPSEEESGTTAFDASGNGNHGTMNGITLSTFHEVDKTVSFSHANENGFSNYRYFDGVDDYIDISNISDDMSGKTSYTLTAWIKTSSSNQQGIISANDSSGGNQAVFFINSSGNINLAGSTTGSISGSVDVADGQWHHVAVTSDGSSIVLYVDGESDGSGVMSYTLSETDLWTIGQEYDPGPVLSDFFEGSIYDVYIYDISLTESQVQELSVGSEVTEVTPVGYWKLKELKGTIVIDSQGSNHGTYNGTSVVISPKTNGSTTDADGKTLDYNGIAPNPGLYLPPVVTGNGTDVYADLGSALIPASADFELEIWYYHEDDSSRMEILSQGTSTSNRFRITANSKDASGTYEANTIWFGTDTGRFDAFISSVLTVGQWHLIKVERDGNDFTYTVEEKSESITSSFSIQQANTNLLRYSGDALYNNGRIGLVSIAAEGVTKYVLPRSDTRTVDILGDDGSAITGTITNGTLNSIYANRGHGEWKDPRVEHGGKVDSGSLIPTKLDDSQYADGTAIDEDSDSHVPANKLGDPKAAIDFTGGNSNTHFADQSGAETEYTIDVDRNSVSGGNRRERNFGVYEDRLGTSTEPMTSSQDDDFFGD